MPLVGEYKTPETIYNKLGDWLGECPDRPGGPLVMPLHTCGPRQHKTYDGTNRPSICGVTTSAMIWVLDGNSRKGLTYKWPCRCTAWSQVDSIEIRDKVGLAIVWLQCPQQFGCQRGNPGVAQMTLPLHIYRPRQFHRSYTEAYWYHMEEGY